MKDSSKRPVLLALPKGSMQREVERLLGDAGVRITAAARAYRPHVSLEGFEAKLLRPPNIVEMIHHGSRDVGFTGADWVAELDADIVELLDTRLDPVRIVAAAPTDILEQGKLPKRRIIVASEYERLTQNWIAQQGIDAEFLRSYGATEVFPPEDADCIVDNTATGSTLRANELEILDTVMTSSTRLYANARSLEDPEVREKVDRLVLLLHSVLEARNRLMLELNVSAERLEEVVKVLPCMREPTISPLHGETGYAVKAAVPRSALPELIFTIKEHGGADIVITAVSQLAA